LFANRLHAFAQLCKKGLPEQLKLLLSLADIRRREDYMFDQLVETEPKNTERNTRRTYFVITTFGLSAVLFSALIISLFAIDLDLTLGDLNDLEMLVALDVEEQKAPDLRTEPRTKSGGPKVATRMETIARLDESPSAIPNKIVTTQSASKARPSTERFEIGKFDTESIGENGSGRGDGSGTGDGDGLGDGLDEGSDAVAAVVRETEAPAPPVVKPVVKPIVVNKGVVNSIAVSLPKPNLPAAAKMVDASGTVSVKILVDEKGRVVSADAVSGNALLRAACEIAARNAKFTPSMLSGEPIKISGLINYNFSNGSITD
jgi:outer membrane biosynthesis protein TonB